MGYTHYWEFNSDYLKDGTVADKYLQAIKLCNRVIKYAKAKVVNLAGYNAHMKGNKYPGIKLNGVKDEGHEWFIMRETFEEAAKGDINFCKTARKEYDAIVVACLAILKYKLKDAIKVSSDGDESDWEYGTNLARQVCRIKNLTNPMKEVNALDILTTKGRCLNQGSDFCYIVGKH